MAVALIWLRRLAVPAVAVLALSSAFGASADPQQQITSIALLTQTWEVTWDGSGLVGLPPITGGPDFLCDSAPARSVSAIDLGTVRQPAEGRFATVHALRVLYVGEGGARPTLSEQQPFVEVSGAGRRGSANDYCNVLFFAVGRGGLFGGKVNAGNATGNVNRTITLVHGSGAGGGPPWVTLPTTIPVHAFIAATPPATPTPTSCAPYIVLDSRGSGETGGISPPAAAFLSRLRALKKPSKVAVVPNPYPAVDWRYFARAILQLPGGYHASVVTGKNWLSREIAHFKTSCPTSKLILTGYSQGAQVAADVFQNGSTAHVLAVILFGDPYFNSRDTRVDRGNPRYRDGVNGNLGTRPIFTVGHVLSYCHANDPVCQRGSNPVALLTWHTNYDKLNEPAQAALAVDKWG